MSTYLPPTIRGTFRRCYDSQTIGFSVTCCDFEICTMLEGWLPVDWQRYRTVDPGHHREIVAAVRAAMEESGCHVIKFNKIQQR